MLYTNYLVISSHSFGGFDQCFCFTHLMRQLLTHVKIWENIDAHVRQKNSSLVFEESWTNNSNFVLLFKAKVEFQWHINWWSFFVGTLLNQKKVVKSNRILWQINTISVFRGTFFNKCTANLILVSKNCKSSDSKEFKSLWIIDCVWKVFGLIGRVSNFRSGRQNHNVKWHLHIM